jgi:cell wall-associated NlpC family hydrolase
MIFTPLPAQATTANVRIARSAITLEGVPYVWGGTTRRGMDCSGLTQYAYRHGDRLRIRRTANEQFHEFHRETHSEAKPGDLVFFHDTSNLSSYVYHVGVYEGKDDMVVESSSRRRAVWQNFSWAGHTVSFGTLTHRV